MKEIKSVFQMCFVILSKNKCANSVGLSQDEVTNLIK